MRTVPNTAPALRDYFIRQAEESKRLAYRRKDTVVDETRRDLMNKFGPRKIQQMGDELFELEVTTVAGRFLEKDPIFKGHVSDNQWFIQQSIMHGNAATEIAIRDLIEVIRNGQRA